jgi:hypothetical protein
MGRFERVGPVVTDDSSANPATIRICIAGIFEKVASKDSA